MDYSCCATRVPVKPALSKHIGAVPAAPAGIGLGRARARAVACKCGTRYLTLFCRMPPFHRVRACDSALRGHKAGTAEQ